MQFARDFRTTELPKEVSVKAFQQFEGLKLIHRSQAGDTEAFGELVTKYRAKMFSMIFSMVGNESQGPSPARSNNARLLAGCHGSGSRLACDLIVGGDNV